MVFNFKIFVNDIQLLLQTHLCGRYESVSAQRNNSKVLNDKNTVSSSVLILCNNLVEELRQ